MPSVVLDASVALQWCFPDEDTRYSTEVLRGLEHAGAFVPALWPMEIANAILSAERRKRLSRSDVARFLQLIVALPIEIDNRTAERALGETLTLARSCNLTAYDAAYLELAMRRGLPLATLDKKLRIAAEAAGVPSLG